jgi:Cleft lip and palate transmembrane protein 1 (CLPTM1)
MDQSENTSWLILAGQGFGILLEIWKVTKTVNIRIQPTNGLIPYKIRFEDKHVLSETEAETQKYDKIAFVSPLKMKLSRLICIGEEFLYYFLMRSIP